MNVFIKASFFIFGVYMCGAAQASCPAFLDAKFKRLHANDMVNLCDFYDGKPMLLVNTASHCGFTGQFGGLEALHKKYVDDGLTIVGFASDSFNQAAKNEQEAASICYENFGVTFTMLAPTAVKGENVNSIFQYLNAKSAPPKWNFNKYLLAFDKEQGVVIARFDSNVAPVESELEKAVKIALAKQ